MQTIALQRKWDLTAREVESYRHHPRLRGTFRHRIHKAVRYQKRLGGFGLVLEQITDWIKSHNIVPNEALDAFLDIHIAAGTQITTWYLTLFTTDVTPILTHTYAVPGTVEIDAADVAEAVRQTYTPGAVSGQSVDNSASPASYVADQAVTMWGAQVLGGGTNAFGHVASGTLQASSKFATEKSMSTSDQIDVDYTLTEADDAV